MSQASPSLLSGRFTLEREVAAGGMGKIFRAHDHAQGTTVAVKFMTAQDPTAARRFALECDALSRIVHPNVVAYHAHGVTDAGEPWLAMEWLEGHDLSTRLDLLRAERASPTLAMRPAALAEPTPELELGNALSSDDVVTIGRGIAAALSALHAQGIVHRDIKPANIFLAAGDVTRVKLIDLGIARVDAHSLTLTDTIIGTPYYMAPEQARAEKVLTPAVDIFALGCVLYECLVGLPPFWADMLAVALARILFVEPPRVTSKRLDVPDALADVITTMLRKPAGERPADGSVALAMLDALDLGPGTSTAQRPRASAEGGELSHAERRVLCMLLVRASDAAASSTSDLYARTAARLAPTGTRSAALLDGSVVIVAEGDTAPGEAAARLARVGFELLRAEPGLALSLSAERDEAPTDAPQPRPGVLVADANTAALLEARFELARDGRVLRERPQEALRTLLGRQTKTVGRKRDLSLITSAWDECTAEGVARAVLVTAPAGVGKTRLLHDFLRGVHDAEVLHGTGDAVSAGAPFMLVASALRRAAGLGVDPHAELDAYIARDLPDALARTELVSLMGVLAGVAADGVTAPGLRGARHDPEHQQEALRRAFTTWLDAVTARRPVLIVLEDLHWGDVPSVRLIDAALGALAERPLFVLALARPEVDLRFPQLFAGRASTTHRLEPLPARAAAELVRQVLPDAPDEVVDALVRRADGHAFYLEEMIRVVADGGLVQSALPETVLAMVQARLDAIPHEGRRVLRAASTFGQAFWGRGVEQVLAGAQTLSGETTRWLDELVARELITTTTDSRFPGTREYRFRHALVRDTAHAMFTVGDRAVAHRRAAQWLESVGAKDAVALAMHYREGGDDPNAMRWLTRAASEALDSNDLAAARGFAEAALCLGDDGHARAVRAIVSHWQNDPPACVADATVVLERVPEGSATWYLVAGYGLVAAVRSGNVAAADAVMTRVARSTERDPGAESERLTYLVREAYQLFQLGRTAEASRNLSRLPTRAQIDADPHMDARLNAQLCDLRALMAGAVGDLGNLLAEFERARYWFERAGDVRNVVLQTASVGWVLTECGDYAGALAELAPNHTRSLTLKSPTLVTYSKVNYGHALGCAGELAAGRAMLEAAIDECVAASNARLEGWSRVQLAELLLVQGDLAAAEAHAITAEAVFTRAGIQFLRPWAVSVHTQILLALEAAGAPVTHDTLERARTAMTVLAERGGLMQGSTLIPLVLAQALRARGLDASHAIADARERLQRRALELPPERRAAFLNTALARATLAL